ncbi:integrase family protein [Serratia sp. arafor3]|uniref:Integrase family protein n=1 Tax=Serratia silvae TaxID=2824122 RepID=A0ABT0K742_9GAMM|nr:integrase family protein [Serratia silvae]
MLTVKQIDAAKPKDKAYRLADAGGLFLFVPVTGKKVWHMRYRFDGKEKTLVIGPYPEVSLTEARSKQSEAKMKLLVEVDPGEQKQALKKQEKKAAADTRGIYNHAIYLDTRREMMQWWADWIDGNVD